MSACSRQIPAVRLVGSVARAAVEPDSGSSSSQHCTRDEGENRGCYTDTSALTILGTHIKHVSADWYSMYFTWQF